MGGPQAELIPPPPLLPLVPGVCLVGVGIHPFPGLPQPQPSGTEGVGTEGVSGVCIPAPEAPPAGVVSAVWGGRQAGPPYP